MRKFSGKSILGYLVAIVLIITIVTVFCLDGFNIRGKTPVQEVLTSKTSDSKAPADMPEVKHSFTTENGLIDVKGEGSNFSYHSLDFIDDVNGWMIENKADAPEQPSKLLRTKDGGLHWEKTEFKDMVVKKIKFINETVGWAIAEPAGEAASDSATATMRILKTLDGGKSWAVQWEKKVNLASYNDLWFQDTARGYALASGVFISTADGGKSWSPVSFETTDFAPQHMSFVSADKGWVIGTIQKKNQSDSAVTRLMVLQTVDGGRHWQKQFEKSYTDGPVGAIDIDFVDASTGWFLTSDLATWNGELYFTSNGGASWNKINQIKCVRPTPAELYFVNPQTGWIPLDVGAGPVAGGLMFTKDGGKSFSVIGGDEESGIISASEVWFTSEQRGWAVGRNPSHGDYIIRTVDGGRTWTQIYPKAVPSEDISFVDKDHGFGLGQLTDSRALLSTVDGGKDWTGIYSFPQTFVPSFISFTDRSHGWVLGNGEENKLLIYRTSDGGSNWTQLKADIFQMQEFSPIYFHIFNQNTGVIAARNADKVAVYSTKDTAGSWQLSCQIPANDVNDISFVSLDTGWVAGTSRKDSYSLELNRISGETSQLIGTVGSNMWPYGLDFISKDKGWLLAQQPPFIQDSVMKVLSTRDGGKTWTTSQFPKGFKIDTLRNQFPLQFTDENHGWLLSSSGLLTTEDGGKSWNFIN